jgi:hypothetical protein
MMDWRCTFCATFVLRDESLSFANHRIDKDSPMRQPHFAVLLLLFVIVLFLPQPLFGQSFMAKNYSLVGGFVNRGDFNNDGILDIVSTDSVCCVPIGPHSFTAASFIVVYLGNGDGTFKAVRNPVADPGYAAATGDFNHDGNLDLVTLTSNPPRVSVLLGRGDGTFDPASFLQVPQLSPETLAVADFNQDGNLDIAVCCGYSPSGDE